MDGGADARVRAAAADVASHCAVDVRVRGIGLHLQQGDGAHDLPGLAVAALRHVLGDPGGLYPLASRAVNLHWFRLLAASVALLMALMVAAALEINCCFPCIR